MSRLSSTSRKICYAGRSSARSINGMCGERAGELVAAKMWDRVKAGKWTSRFPIRPVPLEYFVGAYECVDIPVPEPAPV